MLKRTVILFFVIVSMLILIDDTIYIYNYRVKYLLSFVLLLLGLSLFSFKKSPDNKRNGYFLIVVVWVAFNVYNLIWLQKCTPNLDIINYVMAAFCLVNFATNHQKLIKS